MNGGRDDEAWEEYLGRYLECGIPSSQPRWDQHSSRIIPIVGGLCGSQTRRCCRNNMTTHPHQPPAEIHRSLTPEKKGKEKRGKEDLGVAVPSNLHENQQMIVIQFTLPLRYLPKERRLQGIAASGNDMVIFSLLCAVLWGRRRKEIPKRPRGSTSHHHAVFPPLENHLATRPGHAKSRTCQSNPITQRARPGARYGN